MKAHFCFRPFAHAFVLQLALLLLASIAPLCAQPTLQEWWRAPDEMKVGKRGISYLPNFYQGRGALAITIEKSTGISYETWLNLYKGDTNSVFNWKGGTFVKRADFNGDGITDYIDGGGFIYQGIKNGEPPNPEPVTRIELPLGMDNFYILDIDNDGMDDILFGFFRLALSISKGKPEIKNMSVQQDNITIPLSDRDQEYIRGAYIGPDKLLRIVSYCYRSAKFSEMDNWNIYTVTWPVKDSLALIKKTGVIHGTSGKEVFFGTADIIRLSSDLHYMLVSGSSDCFCKYVYDLQSDNPEMNVFIPYGGLLKFFEKSISGGVYPDFGIIYNTGYMAIFPGGIPFSTKPSSINHIYKIRPEPYNDTTGITDMCMLDDVNGDGINDIAVTSGTVRFNNIFRILLGQAPTLSVHQNMDTTFSLADPTPHPLQQSSLLKIMIDKPDFYTVRLSSIDGSMSKSIFEGRLEQGDHLFSISPDGLPPGAALLQFFRGSQLISSRIIILQ
jgi:hypothetical protein